MQAAGSPLRASDLNGTVRDKGSNNKTFVLTTLLNPKLFGYSASAAASDRGLASVYAAADGSVVVTDTQQHMVKKITPDRNHVQVYHLRTSYLHPRGLSEYDGQIVVCDSSHHRIRKLSPAGEDRNFAGSGMKGLENGKLADAKFNVPTSVCYIPLSREIYYVCDRGNHCVRKVSLSSKKVDTIAGTGTPGAATRFAALKDACFNYPTDIVCDKEGRVYVSDTGNHCIRCVSSDGVHLVAGRPQSRGHMDGIGEDAMFNQPEGICLSSDGTVLLVADKGNHAIRRIVLATGAVSTIAGKPGFAGKGDGIGKHTRLYFPSDICADPTDSNRFIIADTGNRVLRILTEEAEVEQLRWDEYSTSEDEDDSELDEISDDEEAFVRSMHKSEVLLQRIFHYYATFGDAVSAVGDSMTAWNFHRFIRDCQLNDKKTLSSFDVDVLYMRATGGTGRAEKHMDFDMFLECLRTIAVSRFHADRERYADEDDAFRELLFRHVLKYGKKRMSEGTAEDLLDPDVISLIAVNERTLLRIFEFYCTRRPIAFSPIRSQVQMQRMENMDFMRHNQTIDFEELVCLCRDFEVFPAMITKVKLSEIFRAVNSGLASDDYADTLNYKEFLECLGRIALFHFSEGMYEPLKLKPRVKVELLFFHMGETKARNQFVLGPTPLFTGLDGVRVLYAGILGDSSALSASQKFHRMGDVGAFNLSPEVSFISDGAAASADKKSKTKKSKERRYKSNRSPSPTAAAGSDTRYMAAQSVLGSSPDAAVTHIAQGTSRSRRGTISTTSPEARRRRLSGSGASSPRSPGSPKIGSSGTTPLHSALASGRTSPEGSVGRRSSGGSRRSSRKFTVYSRMLSTELGIRTAPLPDANAVSFAAEELIKMDAWHAAVEQSVATAYALLRLTISCRVQMYSWSSGTKQWSYVSPAVVVVGARPLPEQKRDETLVIVVQYPSVSDAALVCSLFGSENRLRDVRSKLFYWGSVDAGYFGVRFFNDDDTALFKDLYESSALQRQAAESSAAGVGSAPSTSAPERRYTVSKLFGQALMNRIKEVEVAGHSAVPSSPKSAAASGPNPVERGSLSRLHGGSGSGRRDSIDELPSPVFPSYRKVDTDASGAASGGAGGVRAPSHPFPASGASASGRQLSRSSALENDNDADNDGGHSSSASNPDSNVSSPRDLSPRGGDDQRLIVAERNDISSSNSTPAKSLTFSQVVGRTPSPPRTQVLASASTTTTTTAATSPHQHQHHSHSHSHGASPSLRSSVRPNPSSPLAKSQNTVGSNAFDFDDDSSPTGRTLQYRSPFASRRGGGGSPAPRSPTAKAGASKTASGGVDSPAKQRFQQMQMYDEVIRAREAELQHIRDFIPSYERSICNMISRQLKLSDAESSADRQLAKRLQEAVQIVSGAYLSGRHTLVMDRSDGDDATANDGDERFDKFRRRRQQSLLRSILDLDPMLCGSIGTADDFYDFLSHSLRRRQAYLEATVWDAFGERALAWNASGFVVSGGQSVRVSLTIIDRDNRLYFARSDPSMARKVESVDIILDSRVEHRTNAHYNDLEGKFCVDFTLTIPEVAVGANKNTAAKDGEGDEDEHFDAAEFVRRGEPFKSNVIVVIHFVDGHSIRLQYPFELSLRVVGAAAVLDQHRADVRTAVLRQVPHMDRLPRFLQSMYVSTLRTALAYVEIGEHAM